MKQLILFLTLLISFSCLKAQTILEAVITKDNFKKSLNVEIINEFEYTQYMKSTTEGYFKCYLYYGNNTLIFRDDYKHEVGRIYIKNESYNKQLKTNINLND